VLTLRTRNRGVQLQLTRALEAADVIASISRVRTVEPIASGGVA
jgi:hypothetical protein